MDSTNKTKEQIQTIHDRQLTQISMLQQQAANYPSVEKLEKVNIALEGWLTPIEIFQRYADTKSE